MAAAMAEDILNNNVSSEVSGDLEERRNDKSRWLRRGSTQEEDVLLDSPRLVESSPVTHAVEGMDSSMMSSGGELNASMMSTDSREEEQSMPRKEDTTTTTADCKEALNTQVQNSNTTMTGTKQRLSAQDNVNMRELMRQGIQTEGPDSLLWVSSLAHSEEYLDDDTPADFTEYMMSILEYEDPSYGYQFVSNANNAAGGGATISHLDNAEALLEQLRQMGVSVNRDYLTLDIDYSLSGPSSLQDSISDGRSTLSGGSVGPRTLSQSSDSSSSCSPPSTAETPLVAGRFLRELPRDSGSKTNLFEDTGMKSSSTSFAKTHSEEGVSEDSLEHEVAEVCIMPDGNCKVIYDNLSKDYRSRVSSHDDHVRYLRLLHDGGESIEPPSAVGGAAESSAASQFDRLKARLGAGIDRTLLKQRALLRMRGKSINSTALREDLRDFTAKVPHQLKALPDRCKFRIRKLLATEVGVEAFVESSDATTPDSGVHENMAALNSEDQEKQMEEWRADLVKTEDEIATLRQVLSSKVNHAQELKRRLGITVWKELSDDLNQSLKTVRESQPVLKAGEVFTEFHSAVSSAPLYQKTAGAIGAVGEKTGAIFGGIGAKFGALKENPTYKSFEERVGGVYTAARSKIPGAAGQQEFDEAFKEAEGGEKMAMAPGQEGVVDPNQQPQQVQQQPPQQALS